MGASHRVFLELYVPSIGSVLADLRPEYDAPSGSSEFFANPLEYIKRNSHKLQHVRSPIQAIIAAFTPSEIADLRSRGRGVDVRLSWVCQTGETSLT